MTIQDIYNIIASTFSRMPVTSRMAFNVVADCPSCSKHNIPLHRAFIDDDNRRLVLQLNTKNDLGNTPAAQEQMDAIAHEHDKQIRYSIAGYPMVLYFKSPEEFSKLQVATRLQNPLLTALDDIMRGARPLGEVIREAKEQWQAS